jgi:diketogulonate reductase-like aldo/keto reductase
MRRVRDPRWQGENFAKNRAALTQLETLAADKGIALSQLALAWLLAQGDDIVPIPGTRNARRLEENVGAANVTLSADDLRRIRDAFPVGAFGPRYAEAMGSWSTYTIRKPGAACWATSCVLPAPGTPVPMSRN